ncbi:hypothetical protein NDU88_010859 [Pleurodeles waltl]|uniref:Uncharacterized protein n=1 Tax=Pleurodeles waltl TaxID=8319 RepID=A0AAV7S4K8_PLEWA|nr:hypothetical protein NDU88_010859 [Pleurodeles waltl]
MGHSVPLHRFSHYTVLQAMVRQRTGGQPPTSQYRRNPPQPTIAMTNAERPNALEGKLDDVLLAIAHLTGAQNRHGLLGSGYPECGP